MKWNADTTLVFLAVGVTLLLTFSAVSLDKKQQLESIGKETVWITTLL